MNQKHAIIIGGGFGGLGSAALLAKMGYRVTLFEKNEQLGGRASVFEAEGFRFDMGPSWYLMPDIFAWFFTLLGERVEDHFSLVRLDPAYRVFFKDLDRVVDIHSDITRDVETVETLEPGSSKALKTYLARAAYQYDVAVQSFLHRNYDSVFDFLSPRLMLEGSRMSVFLPMDRYVRKFFRSETMQKIMQYPLVFLGSSPYNTPAIYNIMSHLDFTQGVFYPMGGLAKVPEALASIARSHGASLVCNAPVARIRSEHGRATGVEFEDGTFHAADVVISNADLAFTECTLLAEQDRTHNAEYWNTRTVAPSAFILYLGIRGKLPTLTHHNLVFSRDWKKNFAEIFETKVWPTDPSFYICAPSVTDPSVAPPGDENLFVLVPIAPGLSYDEASLQAIGDRVLETFAKEANIPDLQERIVYRKTFCVKDFEERYNSFQGTALGLAHTLFQTAVWRPNNVSKKLSNLYYVGGNTNPGIGMPMCLISAELMVKRLHNIRSSAPLTELPKA